MAVFDVGDERSREARSTKLVAGRQMANCSSSAASRQLGRRGGASQADSLVLLPQPALDFIPMGVFVRGDDEGTATTIPVAPLRRPPRWRVRRGPNRCCRPKGPTVDERPGVIESVRVRVDAFVNVKALRRVLAALGA